MEENVKIENPIIEGLKKEINELKGKITTFEEKKNELISERDKLISRTVLDKKAEIENTYGEVLLEAEKRLEVSKKEKEEERKKNLSELVDKNTKDVKEKIVFLKNEIKRILKENKIPGFVNTDFYFCLWSPYNFAQVMKGLFFNILLMTIPTILVFLVFKEKIQNTFQNAAFRVIIIVCVYLLFIFIFSFIWLIIDKMTKKKPEVIKEIIELRKNIKDNQEEIDKITKKTKKETNDDQFDYTKLDREIESNTLDVNNIKEKKKMALETFANVTEDDIKKKITADAKVAIDNIENQIERAKEELKSKQKEYDDLRLKEIDNGNII